MLNVTIVRASRSRADPLRPGRLLEIAFGGVVLAVVAAVFALS